MSMSTHWSVEDLVKEINDIGSLYQIRPETQLLQQLQMQLLQKLEGVATLSAGGVITLTKCLDASPLPSDLKKSIMNAIDVTAMRNQAGPLRLGVAAQSLEHVWNYMSKSETEALRTMTTTDAVNMICMRLKAVGLRTMKEATKKNIVAYLLFLQIQMGKPMPPKQELYQLSNYVHNTFGSCVQAPMVAGHLKYPIKPEELGENFMKSCYKDGDLPDVLSDQAISTITSLKSQFHVRCSGKELNSKSEEEKQTTELMQNVGLFRQLLAMAKEMDASKPAQVERHALQNTGSFSSSASGSQEVLALPAPPSADPIKKKRVANTSPHIATEKELHKENDVEKESHTLEDYEQEAFDKLQARDQEKKEAKGPTKKTKKEQKTKLATTTGSTKSSAAATKQLFKRPAGKIGTTKPNANSKKKNCWGCTRCRGATAGCSSCNFADFKGVRLNGRQAWVDYMNKKKRKTTM